MEERRVVGQVAELNPHGTRRRSGPDTAWKEGTRVEEISVKKTPWSESGSELYRPSDHRLPAK
jgi:hypothetical protein